MPDIGAEDAVAPPRRRPGPMGAAGREVAETVAAATEAQVEARRRNAADAREWRSAQEEGRVLVRVPLDDIHADDLPRDRLDLERLARSEEMEELKASIAARGQREPVELYRDARGRLQLKKGWRRVTALRLLRTQTADGERYGTALARIDDAATEAEPARRLGLYIDMVEENAVREDLSFAEMAQLVIAAREDPGTGLDDDDEALQRLYGALQKMKRSNIKQFVVLMRALGDALPHPKAIGRDLGADLGRRLRAEPGLADRLRPDLAAAHSPERQNAILQAALARPKTSAAAPRRFVAEGLRARVTGRECRITLDAPFDGVSDAQVQAALAAFRATLER
jgi:ParB family chromosome partitioning protein